MQGGAMLHAKEPSSSSAFGRQPDKSSSSNEEDPYEKTFRIRMAFQSPPRQRTRTRVTDPNPHSLRQWEFWPNPGSDRLLDSYVYTTITSTHPTQLFKLQGLNRGQAKISPYNTIITAEVDLHSSLNKGQPSAKLTLDLFREFRGFDTAGTFVQVSFPGMFPDLTRWQAEADQEKVNHGRDTWKLDAVKTAKRFAEKFLQAGGTTTLVSGGSPHDLDALVNLAFPSPGGGGPPRITQVTLSRLEGNATGIWEVTAVEADWLFISSPQSGPSTRSSHPVTVTGFGPQFEAQIGVVWVLDHLDTKIGQAFAMAPRGTSPPTNFTVTFNYI